MPLVDTVVAVVCGQNIHCFSFFLLSRPLSPSRWSASQNMSLDMSLEG